MKRVEKVAVEYNKKTTTLLIAVICLAVGFVMGIIYSSFDSNESVKVRKMIVPNQENQQSSLQEQKVVAFLKLKQEVSTNPKNADAWTLLGNTYFDLNEYQNAINAYKKHLELKPGNAGVWTDMGVMYRRLGNPTKALMAFDKAIEIDPRHEQSWFNKGVVLMHDLKNTKAALKSWQKLLKINPSAKTPNGESISEIINKFYSRMEK